MIRDKNAPFDPRVGERAKKTLRHFGIDSYEKLYALTIPELLSIGIGISHFQSLSQECRDLIHSGDLPANWAIRSAGPPVIHPMFKCEFVVTWPLSWGNGHVYFYREAELPFIPTSGISISLTEDLEDAFDVVGVSWENHYGMFRVSGAFDFRSLPSNEDAMREILTMYEFGWFYYDSTVEFVKWAGAEKLKKFTKPVVAEKGRTIQERRHG